MAWPMVRPRIPVCSHSMPMLCHWYVNGMANGMDYGMVNNGMVGQQWYGQQLHDGLWYGQWYVKVGIDNNGMPWSSQWHGQWNGQF